ncbi:hypothetical protein CRENBAI_021491 [Crenichthys baileyi]|uniref:Uncharacterized protein n=1 Tax=Crenichthys baileyi TaxID=28760 RepID=A0AAV9R039_9TELE
MRNLHIEQEGRHKHSWENQPFSQSPLSCISYSISHFITLVLTQQVISSLLQTLITGKKIIQNIRTFIETGKPKLRASQQYKKQSMQIQHAGRRCSQQGNINHKRLSINVKHIHCY